MAVKTNDPKNNPFADLNKDMNVNINNEQSNPASNSGAVPQSSRTRIRRNAAGGRADEVVELITKEFSDVGIVGVSVLSYDNYIGSGMTLVATVRQEDDIFAVSGMLIVPPGYTPKTLSLEVAGNQNQRVERPAITAEYIRSTDMVTNMIDSVRVSLSIPTDVKVVNGGIFSLSPNITPITRENISQALFDLSTGLEELISITLNDYSPFNCNDDLVGKALTITHVPSESAPGYATHNSNGQPHRADLVSILTVSDDKSGRSGIEYSLLDASNRPIGSLAAYFDFMPNSARTDVKDPVFVPIIRVTRIDTEEEFTIESFLLNLIQVAKLVDTQVLANVFAGSKVNPGLLNQYKQLENGNYANAINYNSAKMSDMAKSQFISEMVGEDFQISLTVDEDSSQCWLTDYLIDGAIDSSLNRVLLDGANRLTNGAFGSYYNGGNDFLYWDGIRTPKGVFHDGNGLRSTEELDILTALSLAKDKSLANELVSLSYAGTGMDSNARTDKLIQLYKTMAPTTTISNFSRNIIIKGDFINALSEAISSKKVGINSPYYNTLATNGAYGDSVLTNNGINQRTVGGVLRNQSQSTKTKIPTGGHSRF